MAIETIVRVAAIISLAFAVSLCATSSVFLHKLIRLAAVKEELIGATIPRLPNDNRDFPPAPTGTGCRRNCHEVLSREAIYIALDRSPAIMQYTVLNIFIVLCTAGHILVSGYCFIRIIRQNCRKLGTVWMFTAMLVCTVLSICFFLCFSFHNKFVSKIMEQDWLNTSALVGSNMSVLLTFILIVYYVLFKDESYYSYRQPALRFDEDDVSSIERLAQERTGHRVVQAQNEYL